MNSFFLERWTDEGNALIAPLAREIARIGRALNRIRINGNPAEVTDRGIDLSVRTAAGVTLPFVNIFRQTGAATGTWTAGRFYLAGVWTPVTNEPTVIGPISESMCYWIKLDLDSGPVPTWDSGPLAGGYPAMTDTIFVWRMLELTFTAGAIVPNSTICPTPHDIHIHAKSY
jgi:hypothetical protein